jgi:IS605 OrfB family transposase
MILTRTIKVKLDAKVSDVRPTIAAYTAAYNLVCKTGWESRDSNGVSLHDKTYQECRELLPSQLAVSARMKATESLASVKALMRKGQKGSCPESKEMSVRFDKNSYNVWFDRGEVSFSTVDGRKKSSFSMPPAFSKYLSWKRKSAELFVRKGEVFLSIVFDKETEDIIPSGKVVGVDRGIKKIAVTSDGKFFGGGEIKKQVLKIGKLRKALQSKGTKSAKRHLQKLDKKENRFRRDVNHKVSKAIVESLEPGTTIVLEDLTNIRDSSKNFRKEQRFLVNSWSFYQLETFLKYKAAGHGCLVVYGDARYTSQKCSKCGHTEKANRKSQSVFLCKHCGHSLNADFNASLNIKQNHLDATCHPGRAAVNRPIVASLTTQPQATAL